MKIFLDTAEIDEIKEAVEVGMIDGITTNPTLILQSGRKFEDVVREICQMVSGPVNLEVNSQDCRGMVREAKKLSKIASNVVVKIPITPEGIKAVGKLSGTKVKTNVTLVFSVNQALLAAKAGANYVSPFIGRLDDAGQKGMDLVRDIVTVFKNYCFFGAEVIVASVRSPEHVREAALLGADIVTVPFSVWQKMFQHPLTEAGIKRFLDDWKKANGGKK